MLMSLAILGEEALIKKSMFIYLTILKVSANHPLVLSIIFNSFMSITCHLSLTEFEIFYMWNSNNGKSEYWQENCWNSHVRC